jgi:hypothetical protein
VKPDRRRAGLLGTVLPAVLTTIAGLAVVVVSASTTPAGRAASFTDHSPLAHLDGFAMRMGGLRLTGWAFDPDALTTPLIITANVDHKQAAATTANVARTDVATQYPKAGPDHGFNFFVPVPEGLHLVCVWAVNVGAGTNYKIGCTTQTFDYGPIGSLDSVNPTPGHIGVRGWAIDRDAPKQPVTVVINIDGVAHSVVADQPRADVAAAHPVAGPDHGFWVRYAVSQATHTVCVTAKNIGYGSDNSLGCKTVTIDDDPVGALETVAQQSGKLHVVGWTFDHDAPTTALTVNVKVDSTIHTLVADVKRTDVGTAHPLAGAYHGYDVSYTLPEGSHTVCVTALNIGYGKNATFPCKTGLLNFTPTAAIQALTATRTGAHLTGWASDPDTSSPISVNVSVDGKKVSTLTASGTGGSHSGHNFAVDLTLKSGSHNVCVVGLNVLYGTHNSAPACQSITLALSPFGNFDALQRATGSTNLAVTGWALDPDTTAAISVRITLDGSTYATVPANVPRTDVSSKYPAYGADHGLAATVPASDGEHTVCLTALNVSGGSNVSLGCKLIIAVHPIAPGPVQNVSAMAGYGGATVTWSPPASDGGAPWSKYTVVSTPGGISVTVGASTTTATVLGLQPSTAYTFAVTATNVAGTSPPVSSAQVTTQASPPNQTTPAPVSTSRYIRNIYGASSTDQATLRSEGATDAYYNPSGHGYLILLDIGGQDQYDGGVVLSATTRFVSYGDLVTDLKAYVDGYHSQQKPSAPITIAIGTNNDMDVSGTSGKSWATSVVNPVASYAKKYTGITIAGANDIEPGFRATYSATKSWLSGYLSATTAPFVFNGSADGCSWTTTNTGCNNGWTMSGLYYLAAGAAPIRMLNLPQIYNTTMAAQWKYISLTGVAVGSPRINFGGTLTEWTACDQTNSCGSLTGHTAWTTLWNNLQSDARLKVASLPYSTDLRIDK